MHPRSFPSNARRLAPALLLACLAPAQAAIFTVGAPGGGCSFTSIQDAVNAAAANSEGDTVRVTRSQSYTAQQVVVNTSQDLSIVGGFETCASTVSDGIQTLVSGAGGATLPVFDLRASAGARIRFRLLRISNGDQDGNGTGGGINYIGADELELIETTVNNNLAAYGGGIYFEGTSDAAVLTLSNDVLVSGNDATISGGGIYLYGARLTMTAPGSSIAFNEAAQFGGGLMMLCSARTTFATVGSGGHAGLGTIEGNEAANGGGVAAFCPEATYTRSDFTLQTQDPDAPARIANNFASQYGGALFLQPHASINDAGDTYARINGGELVGNVAPDAAVALVGNQSNRGAQFYMSGGRLSGNATDNGAATDGALIVVRGDGIATLGRVRVQDNDSGPLIHARNPRDIVVSNSLIVDNTVRGPLFEVFEPSDQFDVVGSTIVANTLSDSGAGPDPVIFAEHAAHLRRMLIWQPGRTTLAAGAPDVDDVLTSEIASLPPDGTYAIDDPRFLDPDAGDYRLQAASPAVDFSSLVDGSDLDGNARGVDIERVAQLDGAGDLGAYERQTLGNLVRNPGFLADLRLWNAGTPGASATRIDAGASSTGAVTLSLQGAPGGEFTGLRQCVRIPGPGAWRLSGFAYGAGGDAFERDRPLLRWRLVFDTGDESCGGFLAEEGNVGFPNGASWGQAETVIEVPEAQWTPYTAIEVLLRGREGSLFVNATTTVHFDGLVLEATASLAPLLSDGFED